MKYSDTASVLKWALVKSYNMPPQNQQVTVVVVPKNDGLVPQKDDLLDVRQAAAKLKISRKWLYRHYKNLPHVLIGGTEKPRIRFKVADLDAWIERHKLDWRKK